MAFNAGAVFVRILPDMGLFETAMHSSTRSLGQKIGALGSSLTRKLTLPIVAAGAASVKLAVDFQTSLGKIEGLVGVNRKQVKEWGDDILEMSTTLPKAPEELAEALYFVASSGIAIKDAMEIVRVSAEAASTGLGSTVDVADLLTSAVNVFGIENLSAAAASDILVAAVREGKGEADEYAAALGRVLPVADLLGVTFDETAAAASALTLGGLDIYESVTALRQTFNAFIKPSVGGKKALVGLGTSIEELRDNLKNKGLIDTLIEIRARLVEANPAFVNIFKQIENKGIDSLTELRDKFGENADALGKIFPNIRGLVGFLSLTGDNVDHNVEVFDELAHATGDADEALKVMSKTAEFKMKTALASLQSAAIKLGTMLIPILVKDIIPAIMDAVKWFDDLTDAQKKNVLKWAAIIAVAGPLLRILAPMVRLLGGLVGVVGKLTTAFIGLISAKSLGGVSSAVGTAAGSFRKLKIPIVGASSAIGTVATGRGVAGAAMGLSSNVVLASVAALGAAIFLLVQNSKDAETAIKEVVSALGKGEESIPDIQSQIETLEAERDRITAQMAEDPLSARFLSPKISEIDEQIGRLTESIGRQREKLGHYAAGLGLSTRNLIRFSDIVNSASGMSNKQAKAIARSFSALELLGGGLTKSEQMFVDNYMATGSFKSAMEVMEGALDRIQRKLERKSILKVDTATARTAIEGFLNSMADRNVTVGVNFVGGADFALRGGGRGGVVVVPEFAKGGIVTRPTVALIGERGPEAIIPLSRPTVALIGENGSEAVIPPNRSDDGSGDIYELKITNWETGQGLVRRLARAEVDDERGYRDRLGRFGRAK